MAWHRESKRHSLARRGVKTAQRVNPIMMKNKPKIKVKKIEIMRAEGSSKDDPLLGKTQTYTNYSDANARLRQIAKTAPKGGAYDKTDVKIIWEDGSEYTGRWDVKHYSEPNNDNDIQTHLKETLNFYAGNTDRGKEFIEKGLTTDESVKESKEMLEKLDIGNSNFNKPKPKVVLNESDTKLNETELGQFTGTMNYYKFNIFARDLKLTDGTKYVADKGGAYWLFDAIASWQTRPKVRKEDFQVWELKKTNGNRAVLTAKDGNGKVIARQLIPFTDFPLKRIKVFLRDNVIMLPSEY